MAQNEKGLAAASGAAPAEIEALYDGWVTDYERDVLGWGYDAPTVASFRLAALTEPSSTRVLDAGCGTGLTGVELAAAGFAHVTGIDISAESLEHATRRGVYEATAQVDLTTGLPFESGEFGAVLCCGVLSYVPDLRAVLGEFVRVVGHGGSIIVTQRTDLWDERATQEAIDELVAARQCTAVVSDREPYLPNHPEFADTVGIRYVALTVTEP